MQMITVKINGLWHQKSTGWLQAARLAYPWTYHVFAVNKMAPACFTVLAQRLNNSSILQLFPFWNQSPVIMYHHNTYDTTLYTYLSSHVQVYITERYNMFSSNNISCFSVKQVTQQVSYPHWLPLSSVSRTGKGVTCVEGGTTPVP